VNEIFAEKDGGDEELRTGTSNTADITLGALLDGDGVVRGRGDRALPPGTQQASRQHSPMSSQGVEDTLPDLPPSLIDPFDPSQPNSQTNSQTNSQDGARTHSVRERTSGTLRHAFMTAISATVWYRLTPLKADREVEGFRADRRREGLKRCWKSWGSRMRVI